jgi:TonB-dependent Receptor Plug Domain
MRRLIIACIVPLCLSACDEFPTAPASHPRTSLAPEIFVLDKAGGLDPNDIESIEVLKGAAAAERYGSHSCTAIFSVITKRAMPTPPR